MIKVSVKKQGLLTNEATFDTQELAQAWVNSQAASGSFGKLERWLSPEKVAAEGNNISDALETREVEDMLGELYTEYRFPQEFTVEYLDVTAAVLAEEKIASRMSKQAFGALIIAKITELNDSKQLTQEQLTALLTDPQAMAIERLLWSGSLTFARNAIAGYQGVLYSTEEKAALVAEIDLFLA